MSTRAVTVANELDRYIAQLRQYPILSQGEETRLAKKWREKGDVQAAHTLVTSNLRFVVKIANEYKGYGARMLDLIQEGSVGTMRAVKRFDPNRGYRLIVSKTREPGTNRNTTYSRCSKPKAASDATTTIAVTIRDSSRIRNAHADNWSGMRRTLAAITVSPWASAYANPTAQASSTTTSAMTCPRLSPSSNTGLCDTDPSHERQQQPHIIPADSPQGERH